MKNQVKEEEQYNLYIKHLFYILILPF